MIAAYSVQNRVIVTIQQESALSLFRLERKQYGYNDWLVYTDNGFILPTEETEIKPVNGDILDNNLEANTLYAYRYVNIEKEDPQDADYIYSNWCRNGGDKAIGYTFQNYIVPEGQWGELVTADDVRFTYLWGTDFKATNGQSFTDEQIVYFINSAMEAIGRKLDITIRKKRIRSNARERNLIKGVDYDVEESPYDFRWQRISRYGLIKTRQRPILKLHKLELLSRFHGVKDQTEKTIVDGNKGLLKLIERPIKPSDTSFNIQKSVGMYGSDTLSSHLFYTIDYDAGFETSDDVPEDLREIIAKQAAVQLLNVIGDGLMSGFSSSSLSMDGISESFSSTQSATSAYFGARIKEYKDDIDAYILANKQKFGSMTIGSL